MVVKIKQPDKRVEVYNLELHQNGFLSHEKLERIMQFQRVNNPYKITWSDQNPDYKISRKPSTKLNFICYIISTQKWHEFLEKRKGPIPDGPCKKNEIKDESYNNQKKILDFKNYQKEQKGKEFGDVYVEKDPETGKILYASFGGNIENEHYTGSLRSYYADGSDRTNKNYESENDNFEVLDEELLMLNEELDSQGYEISDIISMQTTYVPGSTKISSNNYPIEKSWDQILNDDYNLDMSSMIGDNGVNQMISVNSFVTEKKLEYKINHQ